MYGADDAEGDEEWHWQAEDVIETEAEVGGVMDAEEETLKDLYDIGYVADKEDTDSDSEDFCECDTDDDSMKFCECESVAGEELSDFQKIRESWKVDATHVFVACPVRDQLQPLMRQLTNTGYQIKTPNVQCRNSSRPARIRATKSATW